MPFVSPEPRVEEFAPFFEVKPEAIQISPETAKYRNTCKTISQANFSCDFLGGSINSDT